MEKNMTGLMAKAGNKAAQVADEGEDLTPEEEKQLGEAGKLVEVVIHGDGETGDRIARMVLDAQDINKGIGDAVAAVLIIVDKEMQLIDDIKMILAMEVFMQITDLAVQAGALGEDEVNDQFIDSAISHAYSSYIATKEAMGELDVNDLKESVAGATQEANDLGILPKEAPQAQPQQPAPQPRGLMGRA